MNSRVLKGSVAVLASVAIAFGAVGCGGKPSKDAVKAGIIKMIKEKGGSTYAEGVLNDYVSCVVDGSYDKVSSDTLQKLADGKIDVNAKTSDEDGKGRRGGRNEVRDQAGRVRTAEPGRRAGRGARN